MEYVTTIIVTIILTAIGGFFWKYLWLALSGIVAGLFSDLPDVSGQWEGTFMEPTKNDTIVERKEVFVFHQVGRFIYGNSYMKNDPEEKYKYVGQLKRNVITGTYKPQKTTKAFNIGGFQIKISDNDDKLHGWCTWYDTNTTEIEASILNMKKV